MQWGLLIPLETGAGGALAAGAGSLPGCPILNRAFQQTDDCGTAFRSVASPFPIRAVRLHCLLGTRDMKERVCAGEREGMRAPGDGRLVLQLPLRHEKMSPNRAELLEMSA